jgi:hypothetical protein
MSRKLSSIPITTIANDYEIIGKIGSNLILVMVQFESSRHLGRTSFDSSPKGATIELIQHLQKNGLSIEDFLNGLWSIPEMRSLVARLRREWSIG